MVRPVAAAVEFLRTTERPARTTQLGLLAAVGLVAVATLLGGLVSRAGRDGARSVTSDPGVVHVHGLGVNPVDGSLYAATHHGLYRLPPRGRAVRVSDAYQDTMGFTVIGPDRFLGSGHPDIRDEQLQVDGKPPLLGLVGSRDAGVTWQPRSLLGEADFHSLAFADGTVFGWNASSGELMVSADMREWERRSTLDVTSFAVDPRDRAHLVAADGQTVVESTDGGRTWQPAPQAPALVVLAWDRAVLWGADATGAVHRLDGEGGWDEVGRLPGSPQAITVDGGEIYAAAESSQRTAIYRSRDGGRTWRLRYRDPLPQVQQ